MDLLLDIFGFLSVVLRGIVLVAQSFAVGGIIFMALLGRPVLTQLGAAGATSLERCRRLLLWSALSLALAEAVFVLLQSAILAGSLDISLSEAMGADFARVGLGVALAALIAAALALRPLRGPAMAALTVLGILILVVQLGSSHAAARLSGRLPLAAADFVHMGGAAAWIGGMPYFLLSLAGARDGAAYRLTGRRFSQISMGGVAMIVAGGIAMAFVYVGSLEAFYGTAYGVMVLAKTALLLGALCLGAMNYRLVERLRRDPATPVLRLRRFAEVELGLGLTILFAAASLTSQPPAEDLTTGRASWHEVVERLTPQWPRLASPDHASLALSELQTQIDAAEKAHAPVPQAYVPGEGVVAPRNAEDIAWSEYNHHWSGILVVAIGVLALLERTGRARWARHWPLLFLVLGSFLFFRSDPEVWPLGDVGFFASFRDPEVVQHRIFVVLIVIFALFEWRVRAGGLGRTRAALVFPLICALGGALLLTHSHALSNIKEQLLIEITHVPLALAGIAAGWARWLELRLDGRSARVAAWVWPVAFLVAGSVLLIYREA